MLNTHEHHDPTGGNAAVIAVTGAKLIAHHRVGGRIAGVDRGVQAGDIIKVGKICELECLDAPGHTLSQSCMLSHSEQLALFSGDTLFNAGAGNVHNGGDVNALYSTFADQLARLPDTTQVYPGHDFIENKLRSTLDREPDNAAVGPLLPRVADQDPATSAVNVLAQEKKVNPYMRPNSPSVITRLRKGCPDLPDAPDARTGFTKLRELRNTW